MLHRERQLTRAEVASRLPVPALVVAHLRDDLAAAPVIGRQAFEVALEMALDLRLGLGEEAEAPAIARDARGEAPGERARVPQRIEEARARIEIGESIAAPGEVIAFLGARALQDVSNLRIARD